MGDDLLMRIRTRRDSLPRAERTIADLVLRDPGAAAECTITALAQAADTSETTVHRFCRSLDLRGYAQLRLGLAAEAERLRADSRADLALGGDIGPDDTLEQLVRKVGYSDARAAEETAAHLDLTALAALADAVGAARRTELFGLGSSALAAQDAAHKLLRLGHWATVWTDVHAALMSAALLRPGDLALVVSHSGRAREVVDFLAQARAAGAVTAAVTSNPASPAAGQADIVLVTSARETTFRSGGTASRTAQLTVVDCLYVALAQRSHQQTLEDLERAHEAVRSRTLRAPGGSRP
ncbi:MurR/RpiR family transcriptional regulator [Kitasatospora sp. NPDC057223]|jgi:DNA-binding MurR/RpiR family transcriptional regulator|uniref:MurR/RpiR family transcriptional regulator n=1 Tax=Kitasatospora sp. NPDC057223 TaxID=3346055 RepID=UPI003641F62E